MIALILFCVVAAAPDPLLEAKKKEIEQIDKEIEALKLQRDAYFKAASEYQKEGDRWQYSTGDIQTAYDNWGKADQARSKGFEMQDKIDALGRDKSRIYQYYPQLQYP